MSDLRQLQQAFLAAVLGGDEGTVADPRGLRIYANNHRGQLIGSLRETYERTAAWLGADVFDAHAHGFVGAHRSETRSLNHYGQGFPQWLADTRATTDPAAELAWLDNALRNAFYGRHADPLRLEDVAIDDWEGAVFGFVPTLRFQPMRTNAPAIWSALANGNEAPEATALPAPVAVRVWRRDLTPRFSSMPPAEAECLDLALAGGTFGELCTVLAGYYAGDTLAMHAGALLREWFEDGLVATVRQQ
jgi:hypothetical protein